MKPIIRTPDRSTDPALCVACGAPLPADERLLVGEVLPCESCRAHNEVVGIDPTRVAPAARVEDVDEAYGAAD